MMRRGSAATCLFGTNLGPLAGCVVYSGPLSWTTSAFGFSDL